MDKTFTCVKCGETTEAEDSLEGKMFLAEQGWVWLGAGHGLYCPKCYQDFCAEAAKPTDGYEMYKDVEWG